jgi:hypothetical protein
LTQLFNHHFKEERMTTNTERQDRPDPGGIVRRGEAAGFVRYHAAQCGEPPTCWVGKGLDGPRCERPAVMEVYGIAMCEPHGEEAAAGALEEIAHDLEQELPRLMNPYVRALSPHLEAALRHGSEVLDGADVEERSDSRLLAAYPLDRSRTCTETLAYAEDPGLYREPVDTPVDVYLSARILLHRLMRLAFEADATWLVEKLEWERESVAEQAAYALALDRGAGVR